MKNRVCVNKDGSVSLIAFSDEKRIGEIWEKTKKANPALTEVYIDAGIEDLPPIKDKDGVLCLCQWRLENGKVTLDESIRNIHREIFDKNEQLQVLLLEEKTDHEKVQKCQVELEKLRFEMNKTIGAR